MKRKFTTAAVGAAAILALAAVAGCKNEKADPGGASGAGGAGGPAAVPAQTGFAVFPATSKFILGVNLASARSSALWETYKAQIESATSQGELGEVKTLCGFDPFTTLQSFMVGGDPATEDVVLVGKGLSRAQIKSCGEKLATQKNEKLTITDEGNLTLYESDKNKVWTVWLDDTTVVASPEKDKDFVTKRAAGEMGLADTSPVMGLLKNVDTSATVYLVGTAEAAGPNPVAAMMPGAQGFFASIRVADGVDVDAGIRFDTDENAKNFTTMAQQQISALKGQQVPEQMAGIVKVVEKAQVKQNGKDMVLQLKLTMQDVKDLSVLMQQMGQALGGQLGGSPM